MPWISSRACPVPPSLLGWVLPFFGAAGAPVALPGEQVRVTAQGTVPRGWLSCLWLSAHPEAPQGHPRVGDPMCSSTAATSLCHRRGCPQPGGHCWEYPGLCLQDFHRAGPQNLHAPSRSPPNLGCSRFCSQAVPASPRHWNFVLSAFPQCLSCFQAGNERTHTRAQALIPCRVRLPAPLPGAARSRKMCVAVKASRAAARPFFN